MEILRAHPVFAPLDETVRGLLAKQAVQRELKKGERLVMQGDIWPYLFLVTEGELDAIKVSGEVETVEERSGPSTDMVREQTKWVP